MAMKKKLTKHQPSSKKRFSRFNRQARQHDKRPYLGLGPKFVNSIIIGLNEDEINTNTYWHMFRLKYFLKDTNLVSVTEEEFEELEEPQYVILHEKSQGKQNKSENYIMVLQEAPFSLYAEISSEYPVGKCLSF